MYIGYCFFTLSVVPILTHFIFDHNIVIYKKFVVQQETLHYYKIKYDDGTDSTKHQSITQMNNTGLT